MDRTERFYTIDRLLRERGIVSFAALAERLEVSRATLKRDLEYMRSRLNAPIVYDRAGGGYRFAAADAATPYQLPGLWFSPGEIHALLTLQHLLSNLPAGSMLGTRLAGIGERLQAVLGGDDSEEREVRRRVRILGMASREVNREHFERAGSALIRRRRLRIRYYTRARGEETVRVVSPQRLVHYRDNWYLDAYCHLREDLRSFALDAVREARVLDEQALEVADDRLDAALGSGYGIFSGASVAWAKLAFTPERARWVGAERWHPQQRTSFRPDGSLLLELPYSDSRELLMDVLRHADQVEVLEPSALRALLVRTLEAMRARYAAGSS